MTPSYTYDPEEIKILDGIENGEYISSKSGNDLLKKLQKSLQEKHTKRRSISIRPLEYDIEKIKVKALQEGIPYQTLMNSILHKYATGQLVEK